MNALQRSIQLANDARTFISWSVCINLNTHFSERCFRSNRFPCREFKSQHTNLRDPAKELKQWCMASFSCWCRCCVRCWLFHRDPLLLFVVSFERHLTIEFLVLFLLHLLACQSTSSHTVQFGRYCYSILFLSLQCRLLSSWFFAGFFCCMFFLCAILFPFCILLDKQLQ